MESIRTHARAWLDTYQKLSIRPWPRDHHPALYSANIPQSSKLADRGLVLHLGYSRKNSIYINLFNQFYNYVFSQSSDLALCFSSQSSASSNINLLSVLCCLRLFTTVPRTQFHPYLQSLSRIDSTYSIIDLIHRYDWISSCFRIANMLPLHKDDSIKGRDDPTKTSKDAVTAFLYSIVRLLIQIVKKALNKFVYAPAFSSSFDRWFFLIAWCVMAVGSVTCNQSNGLPFLVANITFVQYTTEVLFPPFPDV